MANEDTALREVDQELAEERQWAMFQKYGPMAIGGAIAIVLGVGGWQLWNAQQNGAAQQQALEFRNALELLSEDEAEGRDALNAIVEESDTGYSVLAGLQRAASFSRNGERLSAIQAYREIYNNGSTSEYLKNLARIRAGYLSLSDGRDAVMQDLGNLADSGSAYAFHAQEISGLAALEDEDYEGALFTFRQLSIDLGAPATIRDRAEDFAALAASGKAGVNITGETQLEDLLSAIGDAVDGENDAIETNDHTGHAHANEEVSEALENVENGATAEVSDITENEDQPAPETSENE